MYLAGSDIDTECFQIANELGADRYQVMYAYMKLTKNFLSMKILITQEQIEIILLIPQSLNFDVTFASREVKRHIYCSC